MNKKNRKRYNKKLRKKREKESLITFIFIQSWLFAALLIYLYLL